MRFETRAIHAGLDSANAARAIVPPVYHSTIYELNEAGKQDDELLYSRLDNPNRRQWGGPRGFARRRGAAAAAFASGIAAAAAVLHALEPGDHVIFPEDLYSGHRMMITGLMNRWKLGNKQLHRCHKSGCRTGRHPAQHPPHLDGNAL